MFKRVSAAVLVSLLPALLFGVEIVPANPVPVYTMVRVVTSPGADVWILSIAGGEIKDVDVEYARDGMVVFTGAPGSYAVLGKEDGKQFTRVVTITGLGPVPPDPPGPGPGPQPDPNPPDDSVPSRISRMVIQHVPAANRSACTPLAGGYRAVAGRIGVDLFTPESIRDATRSKSTEVLQGQVAQWAAFYTEIAKFLTPWANAKARTREDYRAMWLDIAAGLELVTRRPVHAGTK